MKNFLKHLILISTVMILSGCSVSHYYAREISNKHDPSMSSESLDKTYNPPENPVKQDVNVVGG